MLCIAELWRKSKCFNFKLLKSPKIFIALNLLGRGFFQVCLEIFPTKDANIHY